MQIQNIEALLRANSYPGRGIILGRSADNRHAVAAYFIMGRSENSRNRVFLETEDGIRTQAQDPSKMTDPSLIIYHPVRVLDGYTIVTNGDQTDTIRDMMVRGGNFRDALLTRTFEPDGPNWTPRISGLLRPDHTYSLSILKSLYGDERCCCRYFYDYDAPLPGLGHFIHTYQGDGSPLPSFEGEPVPVALSDSTAAGFTGRLWDALNPDNRVSLFVRFLDMETGETEDILQNRY